MFPSLHNPICFGARLNGEKCAELHEKIGGDHRDWWSSRIINLHRIISLKMVLTPIEYVVKYDDVQKYVVIYGDVLNFLVMY